MLLWDELKRLEPELADAIESTLGSAEFAAMMTMGQVKGQPSFLEKLADANPTTPENLPDLWRELVAQATDWLSLNSKQSTCF
ncbi:hypothetical protein MNBD_GAMMA19-180 [hydrothermal vent metagenome]|uniref:Uncharacterized protein n=1 Tax=hydrothermal vent metagenome TaxID=652676 RepID=A0A3B1AHS0_9ZZZZ